MYVLLSTISKSSVFVLFSLQGSLLRSVLYSNELKLEFKKKFELELKLVTGKK